MAKTPIQEASEASEETQVRMSFGEHLDELRKRIMRAAMGALLGVGLCVFFMSDIYNFVTRPYVLVANAHHLPDVMSAIKPQEAFFTPLTLAVKAGLLLTSPWIIFQLWQFIGAGLYTKERKVIYRYIGPSALLFLLGVAFFYFIVLPLTLSFFFSFTAKGGSTHLEPNWWDRFLLHMVEGTPVPTATSPSTAAATAATATATGPEALIGPGAIPTYDHNPDFPADGHPLWFYHTGEQKVKFILNGHIFIPMVVEEGALLINTWRAEDYLNFVAFSALVFGLSFQLPMVILILAQIDMVQTQTFRNIRKYAYFGILVAAVIVAPSGDLLTLAFLFIPLVGLYEIGILAAAFATRNRPKEED